MSKTKCIFLNGLIDLAQSRLGSKIVYKTDEFFAPAKRIIILGLLYLRKVFLISMENGWMDGKQEEKGLRAMTI